MFLAYKDQLIQYLERFIQDLITLGGRIARLILELEEGGSIEQLLRAAAAREAADATPQEAAYAAQAAYERWAGRWTGSAAWFLSRDGRESQARLLRGRALGAIPQLLAVVRALNERRAGRSDRSADFRTLARCFPSSPPTALPSSPARSPTTWPRGSSCWAPPPGSTSAPCSAAWRPTRPGRRGAGERARPP